MGLENGKIGCQKKKIKLLIFNESGKIWGQIIEKCVGRKANHTVCRKQTW